MSSPLQILLTSPENSVPSGDCVCAATLSTNQTISRALNTATNVSSSYACCFSTTASEGDGTADQQVCTLEDAESDCPYDFSAWVQQLCGHSFVIYIDASSRQRSGRRDWVVEIPTSFALKSHRLCTSSSVALSSASPFTGADFVLAGDTSPLYLDATLACACSGSSSSSSSGGSTVLPTPLEGVGGSSSRQRVSVSASAKTTSQLIYTYNINGTALSPDDSSRYIAEVRTDSRSEAWIDVTDSVRSCVQTRGNGSQELPHALLQIGAYPLPTGESSGVANRNQTTELQTQFDSMTSSHIDGYTSSDNILPKVFESFLTRMRQTDVNGLESIQLMSAVYVKYGGFMAVPLERANRFPAEVATDTEAGNEVQFVSNSSGWACFDTRFAAGVDGRSVSFIHSFSNLDVFGISLRTVVVSQVPLTLRSPLTSARVTILSSTAVSSLQIEPPRKVDFSFRVELAWSAEYCASSSSSSTSTSGSGICPRAPSTLGIDRVMRIKQPKNGRYFKKAVISVRQINATRYEYSSSSSSSTTSSSSNSSLTDIYTVEATVVDIQRGDSKIEFWILGKKADVLLKDGASPSSSLKINARGSWYPSEGAFAGMNAVLSKRFLAILGIFWLLVLPIIIVLAQPTDLTEKWIIAKVVVGVMFLVFTVEFWITIRTYTCEPEDIVSTYFERAAEAIPEGDSCRMERSDSSLLGFVTVPCLLMASYLSFEGLKVIVFVADKMGTADWRRRRRLVSLLCRIIFASFALVRLLSKTLESDQGNWSNPVGIMLRWMFFHELPIPIPDKGHRVAIMFLLASCGYLLWATNTRYLGSYRFHLARVLVQDVGALIVLWVFTEVTLAKDPSLHISNLTLNCVVILINGASRGYRSGRMLRLPTGLMMIGSCFVAVASPSLRREFWVATNFVASLILLLCVVAGPEGPYERAAETVANRLHTSTFAAAMIMEAGLYLLVLGLGAAAAINIVAGITIISIVGVGVLALAVLWVRYQTDIDFDDCCCCCCCMGGEGDTHELFETAGRVLEDFWLRLRHADPALWMPAMGAGLAVTLFSLISYAGCRGKDQSECESNGVWAAVMLMYMVTTFWFCHAQDDVMEEEGEEEEGKKAERKEVGREEAEEEVEGEVCSFSASDSSSMILPGLHSPSGKNQHAFTGEIIDDADKGSREDVVAGTLFPISETSQSAEVKGGKKTGPMSRRHKSNSSVSDFFGVKAPAVSASALIHNLGTQVRDKLSDTVRFHLKLDMYGGKQEGGAGTMFGQPPPPFIPEVSEIGYLRTRFFAIRKYIRARFYCQLLEFNPEKLKYQNPNLPIITIRFRKDYVLKVLVGAFTKALAIPYIYLAFETRPKKRGGGKRKKAKDMASNTGVKGDHTKPIRAIEMVEMKKRADVKSEKPQPGERDYQAIATSFDKGGGGGHVKIETKDGDSDDDDEEDDCGTEYYEDVTKTPFYLEESLCCVLLDLGVVRVEQHPLDYFRAPFVLVGALSASVAMLVVISTLGVNAMWWIRYYMIETYTNTSMFSDTLRFHPVPTRYMLVPTSDSILFHFFGYLLWWVAEFQGIKIDDVLLLMETYARLVIPVACLVTSLLIINLYVRYKSDMLQLRNGKCGFEKRDRYSPIAAPRLIPIVTFNTVAAYVVSLWLTLAFILLTTLVVAVKPIRTSVIPALNSIAITYFSLGILQFLLWLFGKVFFATPDGYGTIRWNLIYGIVAYATYPVWWSFVVNILLLKIASWFLTILVSIVRVFSPGSPNFWLQKMDMGFFAYHSLLLQDHAHNNPHVVGFGAIMQERLILNAKACTEMKRREAQRAQKLFAISKGGSVKANASFSRKSSCFDSCNDVGNGIDQNNTDKQLQLLLAQKRRYFLGRRARFRWRWAKMLITQYRIKDVRDAFKLKRRRAALDIARRKASELATEISFRRMFIGEDQLRSVVGILNTNDFLQRVDVSRNDLGPEAGAHLVQLIDACDIEELDVSWACLGDEGIGVFCDSVVALNCAMCLRSLAVVGNGITDVGAKALLRLVKATPTLLELSFLNQDKTQQPPAPCVGSVVGAYRYGYEYETGCRGVLPGRIEKLLPVVSMMKSYVYRSERLLAKTRDSKHQGVSGAASPVHREDEFVISEVIRVLPGARRILCRPLVRETPRMSISAKNDMNDGAGAESSKISRRRPSLSSLSNEAFWTKDYRYRYNLISDRMVRKLEIAIRENVKHHRQRNLAFGKPWDSSNFSKSKGGLPPQTDAKSFAVLPTMKPRLENHASNSAMGTPLTVTRCGRKGQYTISYRGRLLTLLSPQGDVGLMQAGVKGVDSNKNGNALSNTTDDARASSPVDISVATQAQKWQILSRSRRGAKTVQHDVWHLDSLSQIRQRAVVSIRSVASGRFLSVRRPRAVLRCKGKNQGHSEEIRLRRVDGGGGGGGGGLMMGSRGKRHAFFFASATGWGLELGGDDGGGVSIPGARRSHLLRATKEPGVVQSAKHVIELASQRFHDQAGNGAEELKDHDGLLDELGLLSRRFQNQAADDVEESKGYDKRLERLKIQPQQFYTQAANDDGGSNDRGGLLDRVTSPQTPVRRFIYNETGSSAEELNGRDDLLDGLTSTQAPTQAQSPRFENEASDGAEELKGSNRVLDQKASPESQLESEQGQGTSNTPANFAEKVGTSEQKISSEIQSEQEQQRVESDVFKMKNKSMRFTVDL
eukprot:jgi/Bigna1/68254/fgenesh1_pg.5_\